MNKTTSLQAWGKLVAKLSGRRLRIEERKDRQVIYRAIEKLNLTHEKLTVIYPKDGLDKDSFKNTVQQIGFPYWISATPLPTEKDVERLSFLNINSVDDGWEYIQNIVGLQKYKLLIIQYPTNIVFKGSALISQSGNGIAEFIKGDHHVDLVEGKGIYDPLIFRRAKIIKYSQTISKKFQDELFNKVKGTPGHFEFQYGKLNGKDCLSFFDYNDEFAYENIDHTFEDLIALQRKKIEKNLVLKGVPASPGTAEGIVKIILNTDFPERLHEFKNGEILVTDRTTPEMTPIMLKASAIVTDMGGVTSHAAIVCRELKIPCVVGTINITKKVHNGQKIGVNAHTGEIVSF